MKKLISIGVLVWLVLGLLGFAHAEEKSPLVLTIESDKKIYAERVLINVNAELKNTSKIEVLINTNVSRTITLRLTDTKGNEIEPLVKGTFEDPGVSEKDFILLRPKEHCLLPLVKDGEFIRYSTIYVYPNLKKGEYLLTAKYDNHDNRYNIHWENGKLVYDVMKGVWEGTLTL